MSEVETFHDSQAERETEEEEVIFRENNPRVENSTPPNMISFRQPGIYRVARPYRLKTYHKNRGLKSQYHTA